MVRHRGEGAPNARWTEADVRSLYRYFRSLEPVAVVAGPSHRPAGWKPPSS